MRLLSARLIISLIIGVTIVSLCSSYYQSYVLARGLRKDLDHRAQVLGRKSCKQCRARSWTDATRTLQKTVQQFANREHLAGLAVYDPQGHPVAVTTNLQPLMESAPAIVLDSLKGRSRHPRVPADRHRVGAHLRTAAPPWRPADR